MRDFKIGAEVFYMENNVVTMGVISRKTTNEHINSETTYFYYMVDAPRCGGFDGNEVFKSKKELIKTL